MNIGDIELANLCVGDQEVKAYLGDVLVWEKTEEQEEEPEE